MDREISYMTCLVCPRILAASVGMIEKCVCYDFILKGIEICWYFMLERM